jgi:hypothetical protein
LEKLRQQIEVLILRLDKPDDLKVALADLSSVYPFNEYEFIISHLLAADKLTLDEYLDLRDSYIYRNLYLHLFEISPEGVWRSLGTRAPERVGARTLTAPQEARCSLQRAV